MAAPLKLTGSEIKVLGTTTTPVKVRKQAQRNCFKITDVIDWHLKNPSVNNI
jgi:hypothetical protein